MTAVDVHRVGDDLENIKRNTYRKNDSIYHKTSVVAKPVADISEKIENGNLCTEDVVEDVGKEVGVLEIAEYP